MADPVKINPNLPPALRKQVKEANRLMAEQGAPTPPAATAPPAGDPPPPNLPNVGAQLPADAQPAPPGPSATAQPVPPSQPAPEADPVRDLNHKLSVLQGKYNAETSRLMGQTQALLEQNRQLLDQIQQRPAAPAPAPRRPEDTFASAVTAQERTEYGEELLGIMAKIAAATTSEQVKTLQSEVERMRGQVQTSVKVANDTVMQNMWAQLDREVPNWKMINVSQEFVDWLAVEDIMSGTARNTGLVAAFNAGNASRVIGIFKRFIEEDARSRSTSPSSVAPQVNRETLIAPGRGSGSAAPAGTSSGRSFTEQEIDDFYSRVQRKRISPEEKASTEKEINAAVAEGRVIPRHSTRHISNGM
jgi:hypothetical protein